MPAIEKPYFYAFADLEHIQLGDTPDWPQHITLTPPVSEIAEAPIDEIIEHMQRRIGELGRITVNSGALEQFGPKAGVSVLRIGDPTGRLRYLHQILMNCFNDTPYEHTISRNHAGDRYRSHTTPIPGRTPLEGVFHIDSVAIGRATRLGKEMYRRLPLYPNATF